MEDEAPYPPIVCGRDRDEAEQLAGIGPEPWNSSGERIKQEVHGDANKEGTDHRCSPPEKKRDRDGQPKGGNMRQQEMVVERTVHEIEPQ